MKIPYVIDNQTHRLVEVLRDLLDGHAGKSLDIDTKALAARIRGDLEREPFSEATPRLIEDLTRFLRRDASAVRLYEDGFLHAKCYLFYNDSPVLGWDRFQPVAGIVGSTIWFAPRPAGGRCAPAAGASGSCRSR